MSLIPSIVSSGSSQDPNDKGWFATPAALRAAYPTGQDGWFAIVGSTDTVWVWDAGTGDWVDSGASGTGDVTGPASSTNNNVALFDGTTGKIIKDGGALGSLATKNTVANADIDSGAVDTNQLASDAVTTPKIVDGNVSDAKLGTGINANKIGSGNVTNTEFEFINGTTSNLQAQIDAKLAEANSIFMPGYTKYCVDNRDDLATVIASITNESTVVNISQGSFGGTTPLVINKDNIALIAPPATPAIVEFAYEISTATTADRIRMRYMQFDNDFNAGSKRSSYNHCTFNQDLNIQTSATAGYMTFFNCEFAADTTISVQNTFASTVYFINCNFAGCSFSLNQASNLQVIFSNCSNFISFPTNATYTHTNILTNGFSQNSVTKTLLATGSGTSGQVLTSGGAGLPDTWATPVSSTTDLSDVSTTLPAGGQVLQYSTTTSRYEPVTLSTGGGTVTSVDVAAGTGITSSGGPVTGSGSITVGLDTATQNTLAQVSTNTADIGTKISASSTDTLTNKTIDADLNTISNIDNSEIKAAAGIEATKISSGIISNTEFDYLNGVTSNIQTQIDAKAPLASPNFTGTVSTNNLSTVGVSATSVNTTSIQTGSFQLGSTATTGYVLKTDGSGNGTWQPESGGGGGGTVSSVNTGNGLSGGPITTTGTIELNFVETFTTAGNGSVTAPTGAKFVKVIACGGGGGGGGSGFAFLDVVSGYQGAGGGGGGAGEISIINIPVNGGVTQLFFNVGSGGAGGAGQTSGVPSSSGINGSPTYISPDSSYTDLFVEALGGSGGGNSQTDPVSGGVEVNGGDGGSGEYGGGGGGRGSYNGASAIYGSNGNGGSGNPLTGKNATNSASGDGAYNPNSGFSSTSGPGGGGGGPNGGSGGDNGASGSNGSRGGGGGGAGGANSIGGFTPGNTGGAGGDGFITFIWYFE